ncbi:MAG: hypothetical protein NVSMB59_21820 [Vulcanimicrobiaceae bacterium]
MPVEPPATTAPRPSVLPTHADTPVPRVIRDEPASRALPSPIPTSAVSSASIDAQAAADARAAAARAQTATEAAAARAAADAKAATDARARAVAQSAAEAKAIADARAAADAKAAAAAASAASRPADKGAATLANRPLGPPDIGSRATGVDRLNGRLNAMLPQGAPIAYASKHYTNDVRAAIDEAQAEYYRAAAPPPDVLAKVIRVVKQGGGLVGGDPAIVYILKRRTIFGIEICTGWKVQRVPGSPTPQGGYTFGPCGGEEFVPQAGLPTPQPRDGG